MRPGVRCAARSTRLHERDLHQEVRLHLALVERAPRERLRLGHQRGALAERARRVARQALEQRGEGVEHGVDEARRKSSACVGPS